LEEQMKEQLAGIVEDMQNRINETLQTASEKIAEQ